MDDKIFLGVLTYIMLSTLISGFLPNELYQGTKYQDTSDEFLEQYGTDDAALEGTREQIGFFRKIVTFLFAAWSIEGIPALIGVVITLINLISFLVGAVYVYDKVRGIGS